MPIARGLVPSFDEAPGAFDCPGHVIRHVHNPDLLDINANRWNDTGLTIKVGDRLDFDVLPGATIVWRPGGLLTLSSAGEAPPSDDVTATPYNTLCGSSRRYRSMWRLLALSLV